VFGAAVAIARGRSIAFGIMDETSSVPHPPDTEPSYCAVSLPCPWVLDIRLAPQNRPPSVVRGRAAFGWAFSPRPNTNILEATMGGALEHAGT
jgi:hypothetical protein